VLGPDSVEASRIALAAKAQLSGDRLFEYHTRLLATRGRVGGERAVALAREMGLDVARLQKDSAGAEVNAALAENQRLAEKLAINGTPAFIIGEEVVPGAVGAGPLRQAIAGVRQCGHAVC
jgi:protein-disulfide isomerase